jgi:hypothetical protein
MNPPNDRLDSSDCWRPPAIQPPQLPDNPGARAADFAYMASATPGPEPSDCASKTVEACYNAYRQAGRRPHSTDPFDHHHPGAPGEEPEPSESAAFARLKLVFDWLLHQVMSRMIALDDAMIGKGNYATAERHYNEFVNQLLDRDPEVYGNLLKRIHKLEPKIRNGRIEGVTLVVEWNPHSSSSFVHR